MTGIDEAIEKAGGQDALGALLTPPVTQQAVGKMKRNGYAPAPRARQIAALYPEIGIERLVGPNVWISAPVEVRA